MTSASDHSWSFAESWWSKSVSVEVDTKSAAVSVASLEALTVASEATVLPESVVAEASATEAPIVDSSDEAQEVRMTAAIVNMETAAASR